MGRQFNSARNYQFVFNIMTRSNPITSPLFLLSFLGGTPNMMCQEATKERAFVSLNKHPDSSSLALSDSSFAEYPGRYIRFKNIDVIFLDSPDSSLRSRRRMTLKVVALKTLFKTSPPAGEVDTKYRVRGNKNNISTYPYCHCEQSEAI